MRSTTKRNIVRAVSGVGAVALGTAGATVLTAMPAAAEPLPACDAFGAGNGLAFLNVAGCVPQYGLGKAEFTVEGVGTDIPAGFDLTTATVTGTTGPDADALTAYYGDLSGSENVGPAVFAGAFTYFTGPDAVTATTQGYRAWVAAPVTSTMNYSSGLVDADYSSATIDLDAASAGAGSDILEACSLPTTGSIAGVAGSISFGAVSTTYEQVIDGATYTVTLELPASTTFLYVTGEETEVSGCFSDGVHTNVFDFDGETPSDFSGNIPAILAEYQVLVMPPFVVAELRGVPEDPDELETWFTDSPEHVFTAFSNDLGIFDITAATPEMPQLAATGVDAATVSVTAATLGLAGLSLAGAAWALTRRRRVAS